MLFGVADVEEPCDAQDKGSKAAQDGGLGAHGAGGARAPPPLDGAGTAGPGGVRAPSELPPVDGGQTATLEAGGEAPVDLVVAKETPLGATGAADPAAPGEDDEIDSLVERGVLQTSQDAFDTPPSASFGSGPPGMESARSPALYSTEAGEEEEMPDLGPSVKRGLPSDSDSEDSSRKGPRACEDSSSPSTGGDLITVSESDFSDCSVLDGEGQAGVQRVSATDLVAAEGVTVEQEAEAKDWLVEEGAAEPADRVDPRGPGPAAPEEGRQAGWTVSPSAEGASPSEPVDPSPVYGPETLRHQSQTSRSASQPSWLPRRVGESAKSMGTVGTVGFGRGDSTSGPVRSLRGRGKDAKGPLPK